jgi:hypothetical protein
MSSDPKEDRDSFSLNYEGHLIEVIEGKLKDTLLPKYEVPFTKDESELAGAFLEDALSYEDALESSVDLVEDK